MRSRTARIVTARLERRTTVADDCFCLRLHSPEVARAVRPGQFIQVRVGSGIDPFLRRPLSVASIEGDRLLVVFKVRGRGTALLAGEAEGTTLDIIGPLGKPIPAPTAQRLLLIGGGIGIAPLRFVAQEFSAANKIIFIAGARTGKELLFLDDIHRFSEKVEILTEDGSRGFAGLATDRLGRMVTEADPDGIFACGPEGMLADVQKKLDIGTDVQKKIKVRAGVEKKMHSRTVGPEKGRRIPAYGFFEGRMGCGFGLCLGCALPKKGGGYLRVCEDGPVIDLALVDFP